MPLPSPSAARMTRPDRRVPRKRLRRRALRAIPGAESRAVPAVGLPQGDVPLALAGFNAGVEVGQLVFVGAALLVVAGVRRIAVRAPVWLRAAPAYGMGSLAAFWTIARVLTFR